MTGPSHRNRAAGARTTLVRSWILALWLLVAACGQGREREEARALFEALSTLDLQASSGARRRQLAQLQAMPLSSADLREVRDGCVQVHRKLLQSEVTQAGAKLELAKLSAAADGGPLRPEDAKRITDAVERSNLALQQAQAAFPECERQTQLLARRAR